MSRREKKGIDAEESRRRREANAIAVRKDKKEESLAKRRNIQSDITNPTLNLDIINSVDLSKAMNPPATKPKSYSVADIPQLMKGFQSDDRSVQFDSIRGFRKILSVERDAPVQPCIDAGAIHYFVEYLKRSDFPEAQFEAAWALTNVASTDRTSVVVESGSIPHLCQLLSSPVPDIREQAAWCLGNVAGDCADYRDWILKHDGLSMVVANIMNPANVSLLRNCTWTLSNFCRGKPQPRLQTIAPAFPALKHILQNNVDHEAMVDAAWAASYISDGDNDRVQMIVNLDVIPTLIKMLQSGQNNFIVPALRTLGNIASGDDSQTEAVLKANVLSVLGPLLSNTKRNIRKETLWMLSNIAAGSQQQLAALMNTPQLVPQILEQLSAATDWDVRKEATWVVCNIASSGIFCHIVTLVDHGAIRQFCQLLDISDVKILTIVLEALETILKAGIGMNKLSIYVTLVDEAEGIDKLEKLQEHENETIYKKAVHIIEEYFGAEEENDSENLRPAENSNTFAFGIPNSSIGDASISKGFSFAPGPMISNQANHFNFGA